MSEILAKGKLVHIRYPILSDREEFLDLRRRSSEFHRRWEPARPREIDPFGSRYYTQFMNTSRLERTRRFLVCRNEGGAIVGVTELSEIVGGCFQSAYMGYWVGEEFARRGFLGEGVRVTLRYAFTKMRLHRVEANIQPTNRPSLALAESVGFKKEGYSPRYLKIAGRWRDHERWAILREDWEERRGKGK